MTHKNFTEYFLIAKRLEKLGVPVDRAELVSEFSEGKKTSLRALTPHEYKEFLTALNNMLGAHWTKAQVSMDTQRKKIIANLRKVGYTLPDGRSDMQSIHTWVIKYGYLHKPLNAYRAKELPFLVSQAQNVTDKFIQGL